MKVLFAWLGTIALTALTAISLAELSYAEFSYKPCPDMDQHVSIHNMTLSPDPIIGGQNLTLGLEANITRTIKRGAYVLGTAKYLFFTVPIPKQEACEYIKCPLTVGSINTTQVLKIPNDYPPGDYDVRLKGFNPDDSILFCYDGVITLA